MRGGRSGFLGAPRVFSRPDRRTDPPGGFGRNAGAARGGASWIHHPLSCGATHRLRDGRVRHVDHHVHPGRCPSYTKYRTYVRIPIEQSFHWWTQGFFDFKEHVASIGMVMLPAYWYLWKNAQNPEYDTPRKIVTVFLCAACWFIFIVGHVLNNTRGFGSRVCLLQPPQPRRQPRRPHRASSGLSRLRSRSRAA